MQNKDKLLQTLKRIDGRGYKAYTDIEGIYDFGSSNFTLTMFRGTPLPAHHLFG